jgi:UDP-N-acetylmuramate dehydrogenase
MFTFPVKTNEPLAPYTWFKIGGVAEYLVICDTVPALLEALSQAQANQIPYTVLGGGSNVLISDHGLGGLVIINRSHHLSVSENNLVADSGLPLSQLINQANRAGLAGISGFLGIPGTVGGAVYNNSHYQNQLIGNFINSVDIWSNPKEGRLTLYQDSLKFKYDFSRFHQTNEVILSVTFQLEPGSPADLIFLSQEALTKRRSTQPLELPSSGCMFKNLSPEDVKHHNLPTASVGYLIDQLGMKGVSVGGAAISTLHANFIVNQGGGATAQEVLQLVKIIKDKVWQVYKIDLETEVIIKGEFRE